MTPKVSCERCRFVDNKVLQWNKKNKGKQKPTCTYPGKLNLSNNGDCLSGRV